jgi:hypothetical protein
MNTSRVGCERAAIVSMFERVTSVWRFSELCSNSPIIVEYRCFILESSSQRQLSIIKSSQQPASTILILMCADVKVLKEVLVYSQFNISISSWMLNWYFIIQQLNNKKQQQPATRQQLQSSRCCVHVGVNQTFSQALAKAERDTRCSPHKYDYHVRK